MTVAGASTVDEVDRLIAARSLLKQLFYQAWQRGEPGPGLDALRCYTGQYCHHVLAFPQYVSAAVSVGGAG